MSSRLHFPAGSLANSGAPVTLTPQDAGWQYCGLRVLELSAGSLTSFTTGGDEFALLPLAGSLTVEVDGETFCLEGRTSVFESVTDWCYLPMASSVTLHSQLGSVVALPSARASRQYPPRYVAASSVPIEVRGAGAATRQVNAFMSPDAFADADRLMCVELLTPDGNWSSYPPHRHDDSLECPVNNEEIYYFRIGMVGSIEPSPTGFGFHSTYTPDAELNEHVMVRDGDVFCVPRGYHGPSIAAPGYPMYYLNVLAGAGGTRSMAFCDDPVHHWQREGWESERPDPRCPMTSAHEAVSR